MRNYANYGWAVVLKGISPAFATIGLVTVIVGGTVLAALLGWPIATVIAAVCGFLLLVVVVGGYRVNQGTLAERDEFLASGEREPQTGIDNLASSESESRIGIDNEGEMDLADYKAGGKLQTGLRNRKGGTLRGRRIDAD